MKREERLHRLFGGIEDELIEDAARPHALLHLWLPRIAALAAAVVLTIGIAMGPWWEQSPPPIVDDPTPDSSDTSQESTTTVTDVSDDPSDVEVSGNDGSDVSETTSGTDEVDDTTTTTLTTTGTSTDNTTASKGTTADKGSTHKTTAYKTTTHTKHTDTTTKKGDVTTTKKGDVSTTKGATSTSKTTTKKGQVISTTKQKQTTTKKTTTAKGTTDIIIDKTTTTKYVPGFTTKGTTTKIASTTTTLPWAGTAIIDVFPTFHWNTPSSTYVVKKTPLSRDNGDDVGSPIDNITITGYDPVTGTTHKIKAQLCYVDGTNCRAAVAIRYEGDSTYYPAVNINYWPSTLGGMVLQLDFLMKLQIGHIRYDYLDAEDNLHKAEYTGLTYDKMAELLFADIELLNVYEDTLSLDNPMKISVSLPVLDEYGTLTVSENGYLCTDLVSSHNAFYIGEAAAANFIDYVQNHCTVVDDQIKTDN